MSNKCASEEDMMHCDQFYKVIKTSFTVSFAYNITMNIMSSAHAVWYGTLVVQSLLVIGSERRDDVTNLRVLEVLAAVGLRVVEVGRRRRAVE